MLDYLIVGLGLAGVSFCQQLEKHGCTYRVINNTSQTSSLVAGGLYNPVVLKRFTLAWKAKEQLNIAKPYYAQLEKKLSVKLNYSLPVFRRFTSVEEQNLWFEAMDKPGLSEFLSPTMYTNRNKHINAPFGYGEVLGTGRIDTKLLVTAYQKYLNEKAVYINESFDYRDLQINKDHVIYRRATYLKATSGLKTYKPLLAKRIIFAEGFGLKKNPLFNYLPMQGSKGEYLFIKAPQLKESAAIKAGIFCIPEGNDVYRVGATYGRNDQTNTPTQAAKTELLKKWENFITCPYEVIDHVAGVRPTINDRKPLAGRHPGYDRVFILNGFGSRGVLVGPYVAQQLYKFIAEGMPLDEEIDIDRFTKKYFKR